MKVLYIHGMGGGEDSRIPSVLKERLADQGVEVTVGTYDFDPVTASSQINSWYDEVRPDLVIGESLGACHALSLHGVPHILVSPAINAPAGLAFFAPFSRINLLRHIAQQMFKVSRPGRQELIFEPSLLARYASFKFNKVKDTKDPVHAFFGKKDRYRLSGIVCVSLWERTYGADSFTMYDGSHYMEEEYIDSLLIPRILSYK